MNKMTQVLSTTITLVTLIGLLVFVMAPASIFLAVYFLGQAGRSLLHK